MKTLLFQKTGCVYRPRTHMTRGSVIGEQGETEGILQHLAARDDIRVIYFGQWAGNLPKDVVGVPSNIQGLSELSTSRKQEKSFQDDLQAIKENCDPADIIGFLQVSGYSTTMSWINNPNDAIVQAVAIRYCAPALSIIEKLKLKRCIINNDPRNYPKDQEMSLCWPHTRPIALLDQCDAELSRIVGGKKYLRRSVYSACENWAHLEQIKAEKDIPCTIVAHAHISDGCSQRARDDAWLDVLRPPEDVEKLKQMGLRIYGKGWEHFSNYDPEIMLGTIRPNEVSEILARSMCGPIVTVTPGFYTGKLLVYLSQNCIPLFYGRGQPHTYDLYERYLPLDSPYRVDGNLLKLVENPPDIIDELKEKIKPDFSLLDDLVDDLCEGRPEDELWYEKYGGYRPRS